MVLQRTLTTQSHAARTYILERRRWKSKIAGQNSTQAARLPSLSLPASSAASVVAVGPVGEADDIAEGPVAEADGVAVVGPVAEADGDVTAGGVAEADDVAAGPVAEADDVTVVGPVAEANEVATRPVAEALGRFAVG